MNIYGVILSDRDVYKVLFLHDVKGMTPAQIEPLFPVTKNTIKNIVNNKSRRDCYYSYQEYKKKHPKLYKKLFTDEELGM